MNLHIDSLKKKEATKSLLKRIVDGYMQKVSGLEEHCNRCLRTERW
jgi:hypothetical protein